MLSLHFGSVSFDVSQFLLQSLWIPEITELMDKHLMKRVKSTLQEIITFLS
jgi:hypothetical protein